MASSPPVMTFSRSGMPAAYWIVRLAPAASAPRSGQVTRVYTPRGSGPAPSGSASTTIASAGSTQSVSAGKPESPMRPAPGYSSVPAAELSTGAQPRNSRPAGRWSTIWKPLEASTELFTIVREYTVMRSCTPRSSSASALGSLFSMRKGTSVVLELASSNPVEVEGTIAPVVASKRGSTRGLLLTCASAVAPRTAPTAYAAVG